MNFKNLFLLALLSMALFSSCGDDDDDSSNLTLNLNGLEDLGPGFAYEGWIMVDGSPQTTGTFTVDADGNASQTTFELDEGDLKDASAFILTIEPSPDNDPDPSDIHILAGDFSGNTASLRVDHAAALGNDFTAATGGYILATPTDSDDNNEYSGVWFLDNRSGSPAPALDLPSLPTGWQYEGWAVMDGQAVSTGAFTAPNAADDRAPYSGSMANPPFPGEDFLQNAPSGLTFPTDLRGKTIVISVEPSPDNSSSPFVLKPLVGNVPEAAADHSYIMMDNNAGNTNPTGTASK